MRLPALLTLTALLLLSACGPDSSTTPTPAPSGGTSTPPAETAAPAPTGDGRPQIAIIPRSGTSESDQALHAGTLKALGEARKGADGKPTIDLLWQPPESAQPDAQLHLAQTLMKSGVAVLVIAPDDAATLTTVLATSQQVTHTYIIALDMDITTDQCKSAISSNRQRAGQLAADQLAKLVTEKSRVVIFHSPSAPPSEKSFQEAAEKLLPVGSTVETSPDYTTAGVIPLLGAAANGKAPTIQAIFAADASATDAAVIALQTLHLAGKIKLVGVGNSPKLAAALKSGDISALILTDPLATGYQSVQTAIDCIKEKKVPKHIDIPLHIATRENMDTPEISALLHPPLDKYLPH